MWTSGPGAPGAQENWRAGELVVVRVQVEEGRIGGKASGIAQEAIGLSGREKSRPEKEKAPERLRELPRGQRV